ncbi:hypothetical protein [Nostoc sp.]|uniref:hypothetical protein n=1 Tax=Nostoc sp. TaxID=1180 RepID=UPI002FFB40AA
MLSVIVKMAIAPSARVRIGPRMRISCAIRSVWAIAAKGKTRAVPPPMTFCLGAGVVVAGWRSIRRLKAPMVEEKP